MLSEQNSGSSKVNIFKVFSTLPKKKKRREVSPPKALCACVDHEKLWFRQ